MTDPIKAFLQSSGLEQPNFAGNSRYVNNDTAEWTKADGRTVRFVTRRFIPKAENFALLQEHEIQEQDRIDNIAAQYFADPQLYWRICDANNVMDPNELTESAGRRIRITLPEGIPEAAEDE